MRSRLTASAFLFLFVVSAALFSARPVAQTPGCEARANNTSDKLLECITIEGLTGHLSALQAIADAHNGNRASGTSGFNASADYAAAILTEAGYAVTRQPFQFQAFLTLAPTILQQVAPVLATFNATALDYSGSGDVTASVTLPSGSAEGCAAADFAGFPPGDIALIVRGGNCTFFQKATNAHAAGAVAVIVYNNVPGIFMGTLTDAFTLNIPVVGVRLLLGQQLAATPGLVMRVRTNTFRGVATSENVIAESAWGDPDNVVMAGAHLDSVAGPGINDNGSGVSAILETARHLERAATRNRVRFVLWGAEEVGLIGSRHYVAGLSEAERARIALYLNFDMIASPNFVLAVLDGDDSDGIGAGAGPEGSAAIERTFERFYLERGLPFRGTDLSGRSDYGPFMAAGIPVGGLFTGADIVKSPLEASIWGGTAGIAYDPCYHQACDTAANVSHDALDLNGDAVADAVLHVAMTTLEINGQRGKGNFTLPPVRDEHGPARQ
jgi:Zn-dependent M28 family amino/carboxypeptidase